MLCEQTVNSYFFNQDQTFVCIEYPAKYMHTYNWVVDFPPFIGRIPIYLLFTFITTNSYLGSRWETHWANTQKKQRSCSISISPVNLTVCLCWRKPENLEESHADRNKSNNKKEHGQVNFMCKVSCFLQLIRS